MEFMAWFSHKYIMHGFLWTLHKDHHNQNLKTSWWERNDLFFVFYAVVSMLFFYSQVELGFQFGFAIGGTLAGPLYTNFGYQSSSLVGALAMLITAGVIHTLVPEPDIN